MHVDGAAAAQRCHPSDNSSRYGPRAPCRHGPRLHGIPAPWRLSTARAAAGKRTWGRAAARGCDTHLSPFTAMAPAWTARLVINVMDHESCGASMTVRGPMADMMPMEVVEDMLPYKEVKLPTYRNMMRMQAHQEPFPLLVVLAVGRDATSFRGIGHSDSSSSMQ
ncbi:hypothetical protein Vretimale_7749 [Volvox reticuliferus]|uniref:Uncharacterized protein n=1 Tax=Volvox reticuliferus TaxID=1737510 RepID=A0A8J4G9J3_9CHLO|nr:hypothetical protein Vretimale_7749 [Volvox reticuliferus]